MKVNALRCNRCGDIIYSRARHDFRSCSCEGCHVDGGLDYFKIGGELIVSKGVKILVLELNISKKDLHKDWNHGIDKFGLIKEGSVLTKYGVVKYFEIIENNLKGELKMGKDNNKCIKPMDDFIDIEDIKKKDKTETEKKIEDYINNMPNGKVSTPVLLAEAIGMSSKHIMGVLKNKFKKNIKFSNIKRRLYIGKAEVLKNLE